MPCKNRRMDGFPPFREAAVTPEGMAERREGLAASLAEHARLAAIRRRLLAGSEQLVLDLEAILFRHDPAGINYETNLDEYRSEAETITLRRAEASSVDDVRRIVDEELVRWFNGPVHHPQALDPIADETRALWSR